MMNRNDAQAVSMLVAPPLTGATMSLSGKVKTGLMLVVGSLCEMIGMMFS